MPHSPKNNVEFVKIIQVIRTSSHPNLPRCFIETNIIPRGGGGGTDLPKSISCLREELLFDSFMYLTPFVSFAEFKSSLRLVGRLVYTWLHQVTGCCNLQLVTTYLCCLHIKKMQPQAISGCKNWQQVAVIFSGSLETQKSNKMEADAGCVALLHKRKFRRKQKKAFGEAVDRKGQ